MQEEQGRRWSRRSRGGGGTWGWKVKVEMVLQVWLSPILFTCSVTWPQGGGGGGGSGKLGHSSYGILGGKGVWRGYGSRLVPRYGLPWRFHMTKSGSPGCHPGKYRMVLYRAGWWPGGGCSGTWCRFTPTPSILHSSSAGGWPPWGWYPMVWYGIQESRGPVVE